jgi:hypothetical protein
MPVGDLRAKYAEVFGEATRTKNRPRLVKRIAWRLQALAEGDLSDRARQRATDLARDADLRLRPPAEATLGRETDERTACSTVPRKADERLPPPGTVLTRRYKGDDLQVKVLADGFEFDNQTYGSLSAVARAVTGGHCNGFLFFRDALNGPRGDR